MVQESYWFIFASKINKIIFFFVVFQVQRWSAISVAINPLPTNSLSRKCQSNHLYDQRIPRRRRQLHLFIKKRNCCFRSHHTSFSLRWATISHNNDNVDSSNTFLISPRKFSSQYFLWKPAALHSAMIKCFLCGCSFSDLGLWPSSQN